MSEFTKNMNKTTEKKFKGPYLVCPKCGENLVQADIEFFSSCPFCGYRFEKNSELEDYILEPVVRNWMLQQKMLPFSMQNEDSELS